MTSDDDPRPSFDLSGKVAVVTGGSRGIGRSIVQGFAQAGADVVIASRKHDACVEAALDVTRTTGRRALGVGCHVGEWDACDRLFARVHDEFGRCDVLVNNAGVAPRYRSLVDVSEEHFDKVMAVNLRGPFRLAALFGERMVGAGGGVIINVGTIASLRPGKREAVYATAKAGLNALTVALSEAYAPFVRCNAILPGPVMTDIAEAWSDSLKASLPKTIPLGRPGYAEDYVGAALWLATDASSFVTGTILRVDGGMGRQVP